VGLDGASASNYHWDTSSTLVSVTPRTLSVTGAQTTTRYNGSLQTNAPATLTGTQGSDSFSITGYASGIQANRYVDNLSLIGNAGTLLSNYSVVYTPGQLVITSADTPTPPGPQPEPGPNPVPEQPSPRLPYFKGAGDGLGNASAAANEASTSAQLGNAFELNTSNPGECSNTADPDCQCDTTGPDPDLAICYQRLSSSL
jgi:hypothetical protein